MYIWENCFSIINIGYNLYNSEYRNLMIIMPWSTQNFTIILESNCISPTESQEKLISITEAMRKVEYYVTAILDRLASHPVVQPMLFTLKDDIPNNCW